MEKPPKLPFMIFIIALIITIMVLIIAALYPVLNWNKKSLIYLAFAQMWVAILTPIGIFPAYKWRKNTLSKIKISLYGNILLFLYTMGLMIFSLL